MNKILLRLFEIAVILLMIPYIFLYYELTIKARLILAAISSLFLSFFILTKDYNEGFVVSTMFVFSSLIKLFDNGTKKLNAKIVYVCTECGNDAEIGYSNWSKAGVKKKIVGKKERLCRSCFKKRTGHVIF